MVLERGSKFVLSKFIFTYYYSASSLEKRQFLLASLLYSIRITKRSAILFYFSISGNIQCYQFRCILSRAENFYTSVQTEMKNTHSTLEKIADSYCYRPFQPFEVILLNTGQNSRSNRYANTIAVNVLCSVFYCFSFPHFHVFSLVITLSLPYPFNPLLFLYWSKQKVLIYLIHFFHYHLPMLKKLCFNVQIQTGIEIVFTSLIPPITWLEERFFFFFFLKNYLLMQKSDVLKEM